VIFSFAIMLYGSLVGLVGTWAKGLAVVSVLVCLAVWLLHRSGKCPSSVGRLRCPLGFLEVILVIILPICWVITRNDLGKCGIDGLKNAMIATFVFNIVAGLLVACVLTRLGTMLLDRYNIVSDSRTPLQSDSFMQAQARGAPFGSGVAPLETSITLTSPSSKPACGRVYLILLGPLLLLCGTLAMFYHLHYVSSYKFFQVEYDYKYGRLVKPADGDPEVNPNVAPVWLSEFGVHTAPFQTDKDKKYHTETRWWKYLMQYLRDRNVQWGYWAYNGERYSDGRGWPERGRIDNDEEVGLMMPDWVGIRDEVLLEDLRSLMEDTDPSSEL